MKKRNVLIFTGPPGSGKGSLSQLCVSKLGFKQLSTGDLCRQHIEKQTEIGKKIDFIIKSGKLISDSLITQMVYEWFMRYPDDDATVILDGYPRTVVQAEAFNSLITDDTLPLRVVVVQFAIDDDIVVKRLSSRHVCKNKDCQAVYSENPESMLLPKQAGICDECGHEVGRRRDDEPTVIRDRLRLYHQHEQDLLDFYNNVGYRIVEIDSDKPLSEMFHQFQRAVDR